MSEPEPYSRSASATLSAGKVKIDSFVGAHQVNIDWKTVESFGEEWQRFNDFSDDDIGAAGGEYFDIVTDEMLGKNSRALDVGCGTGRWEKFIHHRAGFIEAIDPSDAVYVAAANLRGCPNVRVTHAGVDEIPFPDASFDFVFSLGVLHHIPDTRAALQKCVDKLKPGGWILLYLYYNLENRGLGFKLLFRAVNFARTLISRLPQGAKQQVCDAIAVGVYFPLGRIARGLERLGVPAKFIDKLPLSYYRRKSFHIMRNDSLDRFGTPLEQRFSQRQIREMLHHAGLNDIRFSPNAPFWHVVARKPL